MNYGKKSFRTRTEPQCVIDTKKVLRVSSCEEISVMTYDGAEINLYHTILE